MAIIRNVSIKSIENPFCFSLLQPLVKLELQRDTHGDFLSCKIGEVYFLCFLQVTCTWLLEP